MNYFNQPFTENKLRDLIVKTGRRPFEMMRKGSNAAITTDTPDVEVIQFMVEDPNTIQRPIVEVGDKAVVARPIERALELISGSKKNS